MKKVMLLGINSKFVHTNIAIRYIKKYVEKYSDIEIEIFEKTINNHVEEIIADIYRKKPEILMISAYIWNSEYVYKLITEVKKVFKNLTLVLGGPEVSYNAIELMNKYSEIDYIISGEGEKTTLEFLTKDKKDVKGLYYREEDKIKFGGIREGICDLDEIPFPYEVEEFSEKGKIFYYESSRGCPYSCSYCMSSIDKTVRNFSIERVKEDLMIFLNNGIKLIKFIDRTYNLKKSRYMEIWKFLLENYREDTTFHFEITGDLFDEEVLEFLKKIPNGYFQFEIGVQTIYPETMELIHRKSNLERLAHNVLAIKDNIHLHLDLIAGLPKENYETFKNSFNYVYKLKPEMIQLGFLKILKGTEISSQIKEYGYKFLDYAPYEVLENDFISYGEILKLKDVEHALDIYYNSENFKESSNFIIEHFYASPFDFFEEIAEFFRDKGAFDVGHKNHVYFNMLFEFYKEKGFRNLDIFTEYLKYDYFYMEKPKIIPYWLVRNSDKDFYNEILKTKTDRHIRELYKITEYEIFNVDVKNNKLEQKKLLFKYDKNRVVEEIN